MPKPFEPEIPKAKRKPNETIACKLPEELRAQFYALCASTGLAPSRLCGQMIRYALENMKDKS